MAHVADAIEVHQGADRGDHEQEGAGEGVDVQPEPKVQVARSDPGEERHGCACLAKATRECRDRQAHGHRPGRDDRSERHQVGQLAEAAADGGRKGEAREGEKEQERGVTRKSAHFNQGLCSDHRLLPHRVVLVDQRGLPVTEDRDHDRQANRGLGCRHGDDQEGKGRPLPCE